ncbi:hypothetical protein Acr_26g0010270 [Actinidia rufa]|uniref:Uncharacterized protein n=1 Tax=Actinidia rufa TaxID=165716 RepID=A0A7J0H3U0_9ERIC|nr:hypothetical protein Acr_26g0010270 [Actinidia rufa]
MSTCDTSGGDPIPLFQYFDPDPTEPDQLFDADGHHIPQDPLLQSGTFIEADLDPTAPTLTESQPDQNGVTETNQCEAPEPVSDEPELPANAVTTDATDGGSTPAEPKVTAQVTAPPERPSWLPEGWRVDYRVRSSGASAGTVDRKIKVKFERSNKRYNELPSIVSSSCAFHRRDTIRASNGVS